jgi:hypothetical protein
LRQDDSGALAPLTPLDKRQDDSGESVGRCSVGAKESSQRHWWSVFWVLLVNSTRNPGQQFIWYGLTRVLLFGRAKQQYLGQAAQAVLWSSRTLVNSTVTQNPGQQFTQTVGQAEQRYPGQDRQAAPWSGSTLVRPCPDQAAEQHPGQTAPWSGRTLIKQHSSTLPWSSSTAAPLSGSTAVPWPSWPTVCKDAATAATTGRRPDRGLSAAPSTLVKQRPVPWPAVCRTLIKQQSRTLVRQYPGQAVQQYPGHRGQQSAGRQPLQRLRGAALTVASRAADQCAVTDRDLWPVYR